MGYEVKLYLGELSGSRDADGSSYLSTVASIDLSKPYGNLAAFTETNKEGDRAYLYGSDGNTRMTEDCYGKQLIAVPAPKVLKIMKDEAKKNRTDYDGNGYRRYNLAIPLLEQFIKEFERPSVILYGH